MKNKVYFGELTDAEKARFDQEVNKHKNDLAKKKEVLWPEDAEPEELEKMLPKKTEGR